MSDRDFQILKDNLRSLEKSIKWLEHSYRKSLKIDLDRDLSIEDFDTLENLTSRYARTIDLIISKVFRSIDAVELEDSGTVIDIVNRAEKRGLIESAYKIRELKDLRNEIAHEYEMDDLQNTFARTRDKVPLIMDIALKISDYCTQKKYTAPYTRLRYS